MKKMTLALALSASLSANAWVIDGMGEYQFEALNPQVQIMHGPLGAPSAENEGFMNNPGIIVADTGVIVVDPGSTLHVGRKVIEEIEKVTDKPIVGVFNTHVHGDHWLGNQAIMEKYPDVKIYAHPEMIAQAKGGAGDSWVQLMIDYTAGLAKGTIATYPTDGTAHLQEIKMAGETFVIHYNVNKKAHTDTDIMIEHIGSNTLFLGDNCMNERFGQFGDSSDIHENIITLEYAKNLGLAHYVPGHGPSGNVDEALMPYLTYFKIVKEEAVRGYDEDLADYEIKPGAHERLSEYHSWGGYESQLGKHLNRMLLEVEARDL